MVEVYVTQSAFSQLDHLHNIAASSHGPWERGPKMFFRKCCFTNTLIAGLEAWEKKKLYKQLLVSLCLSLTLVRVGGCSSTSWLFYSSCFYPDCSKVTCFNPKRSPPILIMSVVPSNTTQRITWIINTAASRWPWHNTSKDPPFLSVSHVRVCTWVTV